MTDTNDNELNFYYFKEIELNKSKLKEFAKQHVVTYFDITKSQTAITNHLHRLNKKDLLTELENMVKHKWLKKDKKYKKMEKDQIELLLHNAHTDILTYRNTLINKI